MENKMDGFVLVRHRDAKQEQPNEPPLYVSVKPWGVYVPTRVAKAMGSPHRVVLLFDKKGNRLAFKVSNQEESYVVNYAKHHAQIVRKMDFVKPGHYGVVYAKKLLVADLSKDLNGKAVQKTVEPVRKKRKGPSQTWINLLSPEELAKQMEKIRAIRQEKIAARKAEKKGGQHGSFP